MESYYQQHPFSIKEKQRLNDQKKSVLNWNHPVKQQRPFQEDFSDFSDDESDEADDDDSELEESKEDDEDQDHQKPEVSDGDDDDGSDELLEDEQKQDQERPRIEARQRNASPKKFSLAPHEVFVSPMSIVETRNKKLFNCVILRTKNRLKPVYKMYYQRENQLILQAEKQIRPRMSNYYIFDMSRGSFSKKLSKKSGNYAGKLRTVESNVYSMLDSNRQRSEVGSILLHDRSNESLPRQLVAVLPPLNDQKEPTPIACPNPDESHLIHRYKARDTDDLMTLTNKDPEYENGYHRLNFNGRVSKPSIKNFQMTPHDDDREIYVQFGRVSENRFHLDFRAPVTPFQAFCMALAQFDF